MFWSKKSKKKPPEKQTREQMLAELKQNAQGAREAIGEKNLQKLAAQITGKKPDVNVQPSPMHQAREILNKMDDGRLADNLRAMAKDED
ncbi:MAG: hypothetical protein JKY11_08220 [Alphaproteobacteria bacterium]|nr:hypothetical protein [Alphaproteobacteria bacterium]